MNTLIRDRRLHRDLQARHGKHSGNVNRARRKRRSGGLYRAGESRDNMLQAAIEGQGIALAGHPLVDRYLEDGSLSKIEGMLEIKRDFFHLIDASEGRKEAASFCDWILETVQKK